MEGSGKNQTLILVHMPVIKCQNGKWRVGSGPCVYKTKTAANKANRAVMAKKSKKSRKS